MTSTGTVRALKAKLMSSAAFIACAYNGYTPELVLDDPTMQFACQLAMRRSHTCPHEQTYRSRFVRGTIAANEPESIDYGLSSV